MMETESIPLLLLLLLMILPLQHAARSARAESESPFASFCIIHSPIHSLHFSASLAAFLFLAFSLRLLVLVPGPSRRPPTILSSRLSLASCFVSHREKATFDGPPWSLGLCPRPSCRAAWWGMLGEASSQPSEPSSWDLVQLVCFGLKVACFWLAAPPATSLAPYILQCCLYYAVQ